MALQAVCGILCCSGCKYNGNVMHASYPRNPKEVSTMGAKWLTDALHRAGKLEDNVTVTSIKTEANPDGGLLGDMCRAFVEYDGETTCTKNFMVKFAPKEFMPQVTCRIFKLGWHEFMWYKDIASDYPIRIPQMLYGDFNHRSTQYCMFFELIDAEFLRFDNTENITYERIDLMLKLLAKHHATSWGGQIVGKDTSFLSKTNEGASLMLIPESKKHLKTYFNVSKNPALPKNVTSPPEMQKKLGECFNAFRDIMDFDVKSPWHTINHGDPRMDNFFFNEKGTDNKIGLLDWQLMIKGSATQDLSWFMCTNLTKAFRLEHWDGLLEMYFNELHKNLLVTRPKEFTDSENFVSKTHTYSLEQLKEEIGIGHIGSAAKIVIGCGGLDTNDPNNIKVMGHMSVNAFDHMELDQTMALVKKFKAGTLIGQKNNTTSTYESNKSTESKSVEMSEQ